MLELILSMLLFTSGIIFTVNFGFLNPTKPAKILFRSTKKQMNHGEIGSFSGLFTALSGSVGTGNIVGIMGAIALGGAGSIFWILVSAYFSLATKYAEVFLAIRYRDNIKHEGSPMRYMAIGMNNKPLAIVFAILCIFASFGVGNSVQANVISDAVCTLYSTFDMQANHSVLCLVSGLTVAVLLFFVLIGGAKRVATAACAVVPAMSIIYIVLCLHVIIVNADEIFPALYNIMRDAFNFRSAVGGGVYALFKCASVGITRGVFSHEAGLGSSPMAHAVVTNTTPQKQACFGMLEIVVDTFIICMATALMILVSKITIPTNDNLSLIYCVLSAFSTVFSEKVSAVILCICTALFAFSSMLSWAFYGVTCTKYIFGERAKLFYVAIFSVVCIIGACSKLTVIWGISSVLNMLMALPNLYALFKLRNEVKF